MQKPKKTAPDHVLRVGSHPSAEGDQTPQRVLLIMLDGVGLPPGPLETSLYQCAPTFLKLLQTACRPLDACLGVPGIPQSATGQTAILTGINMASQLGQHVQGFPNAALRQVVERDNLFLRLLAAGRSATFANAYARFPGPELPLVLRSVTTVATLAAFGCTRNRSELLAGQAVYHDLTRASLAGHGVDGVPVIPEENAAVDLLAVLRTVDFCLFEYFLPDHAGHRGTLDMRTAVMQSFDRFLRELLAGLDTDRELLLLVSDHGNIECDGDRMHTANPVPLIAVGAGASQVLGQCTSILDVTPAVLALLA